MLVLKKERKKERKKSFSYCFLLPILYCVEVLQVKVAEGNPEWNASSKGTLPQSIAQCNQAFIFLYLLKLLSPAGILGNCWEGLKLIICLTRIVALCYFPIMLSEWFLNTFKRCVVLQ
jgi:hypothetical protein